MRDTQIDRIARMESYLDEAKAAVDRLSDALTQYEEVRDKYFELADYYSSAEWRQDYEDDEAGKLPQDLKRGVLSEDAVYDLITEHAEVIERCRQLEERR